MPIIVYKIRHSKAYGWNINKRIIHIEKNLRKYFGKHF
jgi:hypothetical protein